MKLALAVCLVSLAAVVAVVVYVVTSNKDHTPDAVRACVTEIPLGRIIGIDALGQARPDLQDGRLHVTQRIPLQGGTRAWVLQSPVRDYTMVALTKGDVAEPTLLQQIGTAPEDLVSLFEARTKSDAVQLLGCVRERAA